MLNTFCRLAEYFLASANIDWTGTTAWLHVTHTRIHEPNEKPISVVFHDLHISPKQESLNTLEAFVHHCGFSVISRASL